MARKIKLIKRISMTIVFILSIFVFSTTSPTTNVFAEEVAPPTVFTDANSIEDVVEQIDEYYYNQAAANTMSRAAAGTKWKDEKVVWDGETGNYVTSYFWVKGSDMASWNLIGAAQRKAVTKKYGSVNNNTSYKMETTQHIVSASWQTQGYITVSASAVCHGK